MPRRENKIWIFPQFGFFIMLFGVVIFSFLFKEKFQFHLCKIISNSFSLPGSAAVPTGEKKNNNLRRKEYLWFDLRRLR